MEPAPKASVLWFLFLCGRTLFLITGLVTAGEWLCPRAIENRPQHRTHEQSGRNHRPLNCTSPPMIRGIPSVTAIMTTETGKTTIATTMRSMRKATSRIQNPSYCTAKPAHIVRLRLLTADCAKCGAAARAELRFRAVLRGLNTACRANTVKQQIAGLGRHSDSYSAKKVMALLLSQFLLPGID
jgi:hypothetical protein